MPEPLLSRVQNSLQRMIDMELLEQVQGRCPRCDTQDVTLYVPIGDLLMSSHPTTRLGACIKCWTTQVGAAEAFATLQYAQDEPEAPLPLLGRLDAAERRLAAVEARQRAAGLHDPGCQILKLTKRTRVCDCWLSQPPIS